MDSLIDKVFGGTPEPLEPDADAQARITGALRVAMAYASIDGAHHKDWVIDQMVRALTGDEYEAFIKHQEDNGEPNEGLYCHGWGWNEGIAP